MWAHWRAFEQIVCTSVYNIGVAARPWYWPELCMSGSRLASLDARSEEEAIMSVADVTDAPGATAEAPAATLIAPSGETAAAAGRVLHHVPGRLMDPGSGNGRALHRRAAQADIHGRAQVLAPDREHG